MKKKILFVLFYLPLIITVLLSNLSLAQRHKTDTYEFKDNFRINTKTNVAEVMYYCGKTVFKGTPEEIARQFLHENKTVFGINNISDLKLLEVIESPGGKHVGFIQTYKDIPIYGSETVVSINDKNQISTVANGCLPVKDLKSITANLSKESAISSAKLKMKLNEKKLIGEPKAELFIYPDSLYNFYLTYKINLIADDLIGDWQIFVDATNGDIIKTMDIGMQYDIWGLGKIFKPDPVTSLQNNNLTDQNDYDYSNIQGAYKIDTLYNLNFPYNGFYYLQGKYARSEEIEDPETQLAASSSASFLYNRSQPGFEETNVYYFITTQRRYIGLLGFTPKWDGNEYICFDAHGINGANNARYQPSGKYLVFGDGGVDAAEDQDMVLHEYTHALHDALMAGDGLWGFYEGLISEGSGDYLAVSYRRTLSSFQPNKVFPWDGNGEQWNGRTLNTSFLYPTNWYWDPNYMGGTLWASTLMDLQDYGDIGRDVMTRLLLKSFSYANNLTIVPDHVYYVMRADRDIYGETHLSSLGQGFYNRGFFNSGPINPYTHNPEHPNNLLNGNITSNTTWTGIKWVNGYTYIKPGVTVTSYAFLFIGFRQRIVVENGATLIIQGSIVKYVGADIQVEPGGNLYFSKRENDLTELELPVKYELLGNYPNPFNPSTIIKYSLPKESSVELKIYDMMGCEVRTFNLMEQPSGYNEITWDGSNQNGELVSSGVYIYRLKFKTAGSIHSIEKTAKLVLTK